jgi:hypothetical protein
LDYIINQIFNHLIIKKMKKLKLKALSLGAKEILSREQLQQVNGGSTLTGCCWIIGSCTYPGQPFLIECIGGDQMCGTESDMYRYELAYGCHD